MPTKKKTDLSRKPRRNRKQRLSQELLEKHRLQAKLYYRKCKEKREQEGLKMKKQNVSKPKHKIIHESKEKRQQRLQRLSEAKAMIRAKESEEARQKRLKNDREQTMLRSLSESQEEHNFRLAKGRVKRAYLRYMKSKCNLIY